MIQPPGGQGVAFSGRSDGDMRSDAVAREKLSIALDIPSDWATVSQVHGSRAVEVVGPGNAGEADALWTETTDLPLAVFTADCLGIVVMADSAVGVAHAGWRGVDSGVVAGLRDDMSRGGHPPRTAYVGPGIGPCCFEVGPEVLERFDGATGTTTWGTASVDLVEALDGQLDGLEVRVTTGCTMHEPDWFSHRQDRTPARLVTLGWLK